MTGPLIVFSEYLESERQGDEPGPNRRVYVYDVSTGGYWIALDYHHTSSSVRYGDYRRVSLKSSGVALLGTSLLVWGEGQARRVDLNGYTEAILFRDELIRELKVSPDGRKVAIAYGDTFNLTVLDTATGEALLRLVAGDPRLPLLWTIAEGSGEESTGILTLGDWSADSDAISLAASDGSWDDRHYLPDRLAIVALDGEARVLPEGWLLAPGLRYALRPGERVFPFPGGSSYLWESFDVIEVDTDDVLWTVEVAKGQGIVPSQGSWTSLDRAGGGSATDQYVFFEFGDVRPLHVYEEVDDAASRAVEAWNEGAPAPGVTAYILDLTSGENGVLSRTEWIELRDRDVRVSKACHYGGTQWGRCLLQFEGRVVWEGEPQLIGLVEPGEPFRLRGLTLREWVQPREPPDTPPAEEMVGPLLVYRLMGAESGVGDAGSAPWYRRERVMVHDAGTGRSWRAYDWRVEFGERNPLSLRLARNGFLELEAGTVRFVSPDGEVRAVLLQDVLREREHIGAVDVSPDGGKVAIMLWKDEAPDGFIHPGEGYWPASHTLFVFDLPTGRTIIREEFDFEWTGRVAASDFSTFWSGDGTLLGIVEHAYGGTLFAGIVSTELGVVLDPPAGVTRSRQVSPNIRYAALETCSYASCSGLMIIELGTGRVLHQFDYFGLTDGSTNWTWLPADQFAWSSGSPPDLFDFYYGRLVRGADDAEISILTVSTGEIEVIDSREYIERFESEPRPSDAAPTSRASVECPDDRGRPCQVILDGEVVGEGRWGNVVGFIEID